MPYDLPVSAMMMSAYLIPVIIISITSIMAAINITPAASPVTMDNFPKITDQYLTLAVLDRVAYETLCARTPFVLQSMDQLV